MSKKKKETSKEENNQVHEAKTFGNLKYENYNLKNAENSSSWTKFDPLITATF